MKLTIRQRGIMAELRNHEQGWFYDRSSANDLYALADAKLIQVTPPRGERLRPGQELFANLVLTETP